MCGKWNASHRQPKINGKLSVVAGGGTAGHMYTSSGAVGKVHCNLILLKPTLVAACNRLTFSLVQVAFDYLDSCVDTCCTHSLTLRCTYLHFKSQPFVLTNSAHSQLCPACNHSQVCWMLQDAPTQKLWTTLQVRNSDCDAYSCTST